METLERNVSIEEVYFPQQSLFDHRTHKEQNFYIVRISMHLHIPFVKPRRELIPSLSHRERVEIFVLVVTAQVMEQEPLRISDVIHEYI
jgi:hypothetical protein